MDALQEIVGRARGEVPTHVSRSAGGSTATIAVFQGDRDAATAAARSLASELGRELYRVDLGTLGGKFIGETEKTLDRVFESAERSGVVLFFDEADALIAKRSEVKDSHDRYANFEVRHLIETMKHFSGVVVFGTSLSTTVDCALLDAKAFVLKLAKNPSLSTRRLAGWRRARNDGEAFRDTRGLRVAPSSCAQEGFSTMSASHRSRREISTRARGNVPCQWWAAASSTQKE